MGSEMCIRDRRYPLTMGVGEGERSYEVSTLLYSYTTDEGSDTAWETPFSQQCSITIHNVVSQWSDGPHAECGQESYECDDTSVKIYQACRDPSFLPAHPDNDPAACDGMPGYGVHYSRQGISLTTLASDDPRADTRPSTSTASLANRPICLTDETSPYTDVEAKYTKLMTRLEAPVPAGVDGTLLKYLSLIHI